MAKLSDSWSDRRRTMAPRIASVLYGVIAVMTVDLAVEPNQPDLDFAEIAIYVLLVGLVMTATRIFVKVITRESEIGKHLSFRDSVAIAADGFLVMTFPVVTAAIVVVAALATARWVVLLDSILYFALAAVFVVGFLSSYVIERNIRFGVTRGVAWVLLALVLVGLKKML